MNKNNDPIHAQHDYFVPRFEIKVNGQPLSADIEHDILSLTYRDAVDNIDSFEFTINNWDQKNLTYKYSDSNQFKLGLPIELYIGYYDSQKLTRMFKGQIAWLQPTFPANETSNLHVGCLDELHTLRTQQRSEVYEKVTDAQVARKVAQRLKIGLNIKQGASSPNHAYLFQRNEYDIIFLLQRARRIGFDLFIEEGSSRKLYFGPARDVQKTTYELAYGQSLLAFYLTESIASQSSEVVVRGWDVKEKKVLEHKAKVSGAERNIRGRQETIVDHPVATLAEAKQLATALADDIARQRITASGEAVGLPDLRAGTQIKIENVGKSYEGNYFVTSSRHIFDHNGYRTDFSGHRTIK